MRLEKGTIKLFPFSLNFSSFFNFVTSRFSLWPGKSAKNNMDSDTWHKYFDGVIKWNWGNECNCDIWLEGDHFSSKRMEIKMKGLPGTFFTFHNMFQWMPFHLNIYSIFHLSALSVSGKIAIRERRALQFTVDVFKEDVSIEDGELFDIQFGN